MYSVLPSFIIAFHGCDKSTAENVLAGKTRLRQSENAYDWLGHGIYFWENNLQRALEYAKSIKTHPERCKEKIKTPAVLGAIIDPGHCLNLLDSKSLELVKIAHKILCTASQKSKLELPKNRKVGSSKELLLRPLDCQVIEMTHVVQARSVEEGEAYYEFDTVRAVFVEGGELYENAGFCEKNHIQICVRNHNCIKGYFRVVKPDKDFRIP